MRPMMRIRSFATGIVVLERTNYIEAEDVNERITMTSDCAKVENECSFDM